MSIGRDRMSMVEKARSFAIMAHNGQYRKGTNQPYIVHPEKVAGRVDLILEGHRDHDLGVTIAWLHDVVEDTKATLDDIRKEFGPDVATNIYFLTDPPKHTGSRMERKNEVCRKMKVAPWITRVVKCCDVLDNLSDVENLKPDFRALYIQEKKQLFDAMVEVMDDANVPEGEAILAVGRRLKELLIKPEETPLDLSAFNPKE